MSIDILDILIVYRQCNTAVAWYGYTYLNTNVHGRTIFFVNRFTCTCALFYIIDCRQLNTIIDIGVFFTSGSSIVHIGEIIFRVLSMALR